MAISPQRLIRSTYSAHCAVIFAVAQLSCCWKFAFKRRLKVNLRQVFVTKNFHPKWSEHCSCTEILESAYCNDVSAIVHRNTSVSQIWDITPSVKQESRLTDGVCDFLYWWLVEVTIAVCLCRPVCEIFSRSLKIAILPSVGIDLKELGVRCRSVWNFAQGLKFKANFLSKNKRM